MTKSLNRLKRLAERKKIKGLVCFDPYTIGPQYRYRLRVHSGFDTFALVPLGFNAQAARFTLNHMGKEEK